ncbi:cellulose synthase-like protein G3 [Cynara cardunculus var. scolymus]|uniref:cellulose synthase-like protein G3 n=1 Tax=Cynara cardunculus var. scolymus TaxID=59895 RepID=UPI000D6256E7|nr:cellulose synthase-like protein G3 [Cynara cardunculus var. scolymus]
MSTTTAAAVLHTSQLLRRTIFNRAFALIYASGILTLLYRHLLTLRHSTTFISAATTATFLIADLVLAFMWTTTTSFRLYPTTRKVFPENLEKVLEKKDFPALDIFICTADPYKEPPMNVVNTALSLMAYDYPPEKISVYVSDDGGSELTLFAFMEAAKFAKIWLPFCRNNNIIDRCPEVFFRSNDITFSDSTKIKGMDGLRGPCYVGSGCFFDRRVFFGGPSSLELPEGPQLHPGHVAKKLIRNHEVLTLAHEVAGSNYENDSLWGSKMGFRYGSLSEDFFTGLHQHCRGWKSLFFHPRRPAFLGDLPISLYDALNQNRRWCIGLLEVVFSEYNPLTFGSRFMGPLMGLAYAHNAFWPIWSIPIIIYSFVPQLALLNHLSVFPEVTSIWFLLYVFLFLGANIQDCLDFILAHGTFQQWWNDQRMWLIRGLSSYLFGFVEFSIKRLGIASKGFHVTSKVVDTEQSKRYDNGVFEFGVPSPMFVPLATVAIVNAITIAFGIVQTLMGENMDGLFGQMGLACFGVVNSWPIYEAMVWRSDRGKMPRVIIVISTFLALFLCTLVLVVQNA